MGGKVYTGRALIQFDLSPVNDAAIKSAFLCMYPYDCFDVNAMWDYNMRNGPKKVYKVTSSWTEDNANWKNLPENTRAYPTRQGPYLYAA